MKKYILIVTMVMTIGLLFQSCSNFLDLTPRSGVDEKNAIKDLNSATSAVTGIYSGLKHNTYYGRDFVINGDSPTENYMLSPTNSNRFVSESRWLITISTGSVADFWNQAYDVINRANNVINADLTLLSTEKTKADQLIGEAYFIRALVHFDLVKTFAQTYSFTSDHSHLGVPYVKVSDSKGKPSRNTVKEVYQEILNDLDKAEALVKTSRFGAYTVSPAAVKALKARIYLYMGDYDNAVKYSELILSQKDKYQLVTNVNYKESWSKESTTESILTLMVTLTDYAATNSLGYILTSEGYGDILANPSFASKYDATKDVRAAWFVKEIEDEDDLYVSGKYPGRGTIGLDNLQIIRLSEIYLIAAEAYTKATVKNEDKAREYLNTIRQRAILGAPSVTVSGELLQNEIFEEKHKELAYEGHYYYDLKRLKRDVLSGSTGKTFAYPNDKFAWPIPERETNANPNIAKQQNPGY